MGDYANFDAYLAAVLRAVAEYQTEEAMMDEHDSPIPESYLEPDFPESIRRRDVRKQLQEIAEILDNHTEWDCGKLDFDRDFLTAVRDLVRSGATLAQAIVMAEGAF